MHLVVAMQLRRYVRSTYAINHEKRGWVDIVNKIVYVM